MLFGGVGLYDADLRRVRWHDSAEAANRLATAADAIHAANDAVDSGDDAAFRHYDFIAGSPFVGVGIAESAIESVATRRIESVRRGRE